MHNIDPSATENCDCPSLGICVPLGTIPTSAYVLYLLNPPIVSSSSIDNSLTNFNALIISTTRQQTASFVTSSHQLYQNPQPWSPQITTMNHSSVCFRLYLKTTKNDTRWPTWTTDFSSSIRPERAKPLNQFRFPVHPMKPSPLNLSRPIIATINHLHSLFFLATTTKASNHRLLWTTLMWFVDETNRPSIILVIDVSVLLFQSFWIDTWITHVAWIVRRWSMRSSTLFTNPEVDSWSSLLMESGSSWVRKNDGTRLDMHCEMLPPPIVAITDANE